MAGMMSLRRGIHTPTLSLRRGIHMPSWGATLLRPRTGARAALPRAVPLRQPPPVSRSVAAMLPFAPEEGRRARTGRAAAEVAAARASVKTDIQATPAAAALFKGAPVSPMMDAARRGVEADGAGDDGAARDGGRSDGTRESRRTDGTGDGHRVEGAAGREGGGAAAQLRPP